MRGAKTGTPGTSALRATALRCGTLLKRCVEHRKVCWSAAIGVLGIPFGILVPPLIVGIFLAQDRYQRGTEVQLIK